MTYRWNVPDFAAGYDRAAPEIHPHYLELQDWILSRLADWSARLPDDCPWRIVDLGAGSGRLAERCLDRFPSARATVVDQSEAFLALAERRLERFGQRASLEQARLQEWSSALEAPAAIVSMSAIHHLAPLEKQSLYQRCRAALVRGGLLVNADEVRAANDDEYLRLLNGWWAHMQAKLSDGAIPDSMRAILESWRERNIVRFGDQRLSGDDCHETVETQLGYLAAAGFSDLRCPWRKSLWAVMDGAVIGGSEVSGGQ